MAIRYCPFKPQIACVMRNNTGHILTGNAWPLGLSEAKLARQARHPARTAFEYASIGLGMIYGRGDVGSRWHCPQSGQSDLLQNHKSQLAKHQPCTVQCYPSGSFAWHCDPWRGDSSLQGLSFCQPAMSLTQACHMRCRPTLLLDNLHQTHDSTM